MAGKFNLDAGEIGRDLEKGLNADPDPGFNAWLQTDLNAGVRFAGRRIPLRLVSIGGLILIMVLFLNPVGDNRTLQAQDAPAAANPIARVVAAMRSLKSFTAHITINSAEGLVRGKLVYQNGMMNLRLRDGRVIASNGRNLLVFSPGTNVAGKQDIHARGGGLGWILNGYRSEIKGNTAHLVAEEPDKRIQEVRLQWGSDFLLQNITFRSKEGENWTTVGLTKITPVNNISTAKFFWHPPSGSRTVDNPLNQKN